MTDSLTGAHLPILPGTHASRCRFQDKLIIHSILWLVVEHRPRSELALLPFLNLHRLLDWTTECCPEATRTSRLLPSPIHERQEEDELELEPMS
jgi:hypothetical protein